MSCSGGRYAQASEFLSYWCTATVLAGTHTGVNGAVILTDANADFVSAGVRVGHYIRNNVTGLTARITVITATTIETLPTLTWGSNAAYSLVLAKYQSVQMVETLLDRAVGGIQIAMRSAGMCDCTLDAVALNFLSQLNIVAAALFPACPCDLLRSNWGDDERTTWLEWYQSQVDAIRSGELELCAGESGKDMVAIDFAAVNYGTNEAAIIYDRFLRSLP